MTIISNRGMLSVDASAQPTEETKNNICHAFARLDDFGAEFEALTKASESFDDSTNSNFVESCSAWIAGYRSKVPLQ